MGAGSISDQSNDVVFVSPEPSSQHYLKRPSWRKTPAPEIVEEERREIRNRPLRSNLQSIRSAIREQPLRDHDNIYFVMEMSPYTSVNQLSAILERLNAYVYAYLDPRHNHALISVTEAELEEYAETELPQYVKEPVLRFRQLNREEKVSPNLRITGNDMPTNIVIHVMPNPSQSVVNRYVDQISEFLHTRNGSIQWRSSWEDAMAIAQMPGTVAEELISSSNVIMRVHPLTRGAMSQINTRRNPRLRSGLTSLQSASPAELPAICIIDSGVSAIGPLAGLVVDRQKFQGYFHNLNDEAPREGHGTAVACLAALGERPGTPRARILSYKVISETVENVAAIGAREAVEHYVNCRIFSMSIRYYDEDLVELAKLDNLIQRRNICFVCAAGNINDDEKRRDDPPYPDYIARYPVTHPAQNPNIMAVGAISIKTDSQSIAPANRLSPFSRCGRTLPLLYDVPKPDVVEHGGNRRPDRTFLGLGVETFHKDGTPVEIIGTSMAAPLVSGRLAEIVRKYGTSVSNAETLNALLLSSCDSGASTCEGVGRPRGVLVEDRNRAVVAAEGTIPLVDFTPKTDYIVHSDLVTVYAPKPTAEIECHVFHSDNFHNAYMPSLDTLVKVEATKTGSNSRVPANNEAEQERRKYYKVFRWKFKRKSMEAFWTFRIIPEPIRRLAVGQLNDTRVRYGCAVVLKGQNVGLYSMTEFVRQRTTRIR